MLQLYHNSTILQLTCDWLVICLEKDKKVLTPNLWVVLFHFIALFYPAAGGGGVGCVG